MSFASSTYEAFENETTINIRCDIKGALSVGGTVRVTATQYSTDSPALSE